MVSQEARLSKFEADFKQQQGKMTNKIDTVLRAINDRMTGALLSDTVPKLNVNPTSLVLSDRSYPTEDPQCSSHPLSSINAIKTCSKETNHSQKEQLQTVIEIGTQQSEEPEQTLKDIFKDLHLDLPVLEVLAHALIYNAISQIRVTRSIFGVKEISLVDEEIPYWTTLGNKWESEELIKKKIDWNKPPKEGDRAWHIRIELINPDEERLKKTFQSIPTTRMLSEKENPREIINLDRFHDF
ncbi:hypothetical protein Tco_0233173 [Tanacetum coccineum]